MSKFSLLLSSDPLRESRRWPQNVDDIIILNPSLQASQRHSVQTMIQPQALYGLLACLLLTYSSAEPRVRSLYSVPRGVTAFATFRTPRGTGQMQPTFVAVPVCTHLFASNTRDGEDAINDDPYEEETRRKTIRKKMKDLANKFVVRPVVSSVPMPRAIGLVLKDASMSAVDMALDEVMSRKQRFSTEGVADFNATGLVEEAFAPMEASLLQMEESMKKARESMMEAKSQATQAIEAIQVAAIAQAAGAAQAVAAAEEVAAQKVLADIYDLDDVNVTSLTYDDVGYHKSEMAPPYIGEDQCLVPGEAVVRVEKAPSNSRRIFAGIDIFASVDEVWKILTDYEHLQRVVPNLVVNEVLATYEGLPEDKVEVDPRLPEEKQAEVLSKQMKGSLLKQVGGAKVAGINFSARTTLEVREWPQGLPDFAHFKDEEYDGVTREKRAQNNIQKELKRYRFPRPFALSSLPTRDISMQSIENDDGEFRMYQGVWRMQPLPGCAPEGEEAMRLTYAVEVSPRAYLPVSLVEGRIVKDLCLNLAAIRDYMTKTKVKENVPA